MFLNPRFSASAGNLGTGLGVVSALPLILLIDYQRLMDQGVVHGHVEYGVIQDDGIDDLAGLGFNRYFHYPLKPS